MSYQNEYVVNVDIKNPLTNIVPTFVQYDAAALIFKIFDDGRTYNLSNFQKAEVFHELPDGTILYGQGELVTLSNGKQAIKYQYSGSEMNQIGNVLTSLSIFSDDDNKITILPFHVKIVKDLRESAVEQVEKEVSIFDEIIGDFEERLSGALDNVQRIESLMETVQDDLSLLEDISRNEDERILSENMRSASEVTRVTSESERVANENIRITNESNRDQAENTRQSNEDVRNDAEAVRNSNETTRTTNENERKSNESLRAIKESERNTAEATRMTQENERVNNESSRSQEENVRLENENVRVSNENERLSKESGRESNEQTRQTAEATRTSNESARQSNESLRTTKESERQTKELERVSAENTRKSNETQRIADENLRKNAEIARSNTEATRNDSEAVRISNENTRIASENARSQDMNNRIHRGTYSPTTQYVKHNEVLYEGSTYRCLINSLGTSPTNTTNWILVSSKGVDGTDGGSATGGVFSVNGVSPDGDGKVILTPSSIGAASEVHTHQMAQVEGLTSALSVKLEESDLDILNQEVSNLTNLTNGLGTAATRNVGNSAGNIPIINVDGKLDASIMPAIAIKDTFVVDSQSEMLALIAEKGDVAIRTDVNKTYILTNNSPTTLASWQELLTSVNSPVLSVAGKTGAVVLAAADVGLGNVTNESKATMFTSPTFTGTPVAPTAPTNTNSTQIATTAFVKSYVDAVGGALSSLTTTVKTSIVAAINSLKSTVDAHTSDGDIHTTSNEKTTWNEKYTKPTDGIPKADLESSVQTSLGKADTAIQSIADASTSTKGLVQLNNTLTSTSTTQAITAAQAKIINDKVTSHSATIATTSVLGHVKPDGVTITIDDNGVISSIGGGAESSPVVSVAGRTGAVVLSSADVGLGNVTNESKATMFTSPNFTGTPTAPTASSTTNNTQIANTAFVKTALTSVQSAIGTLSSLTTTVKTSLAESINSLKSEIDTHSTNEDVHVSSSEKIAWNTKYAKPTSGIPKTDLDSTVQSSLSKADTAIQSIADASTTVKGIVQLNNTLTSTSTSQAAAAAQVKILNDKITSHVDDNALHTSSDEKVMWNGKYTKPTTGIPKTDLDSNVQSSLTKADTAIQSINDASTTTKGVVQLNDTLTSTSTSQAVTAAQAKVLNDAITSHTANSALHTTSDEKIQWDAKYNKPLSGIPKSDLDSTVQTSLGKADTAIQSIADASTTTKGIVQLNNTLTSTSTTQAATAAQVKVLKDLVDTKQNALPAESTRKINISSTAPTNPSEGDIWMKY